MSHNNTQAQPNAPTLLPLPSGIIVMWSGPIYEIPTGWALCNGTNGTPDLTNRFILATNDDVNAIGGSDSITLSTNQLPEHSHDGTTSTTGNHSHTASTSTEGLHSHKYIVQVCGETNSPYAIPQSTAKRITNRTGNAGLHNHSVTIDSSGNHNHSFTTDITGNGDSIEIIPSYYKLAFIMKL